MFQRLSRTIIYECNWFKLYGDKVIFPDCRLIENHHVFDFNNESVAVIIENDNKEVLLIRSYRYVTDSLEWEIPAGGIEKDESIIEAAIRESYEETGYEITDPQMVYTYNPSNGISNQVFNIVTAGISKQVGSFDRNEVKEIKWFSRDEIKELIINKTLKDGYSLTALLLHFLE